MLESNISTLKSGLDELGLELEPERLARDDHHDQCYRGERGCQRPDSPRHE